MDFAFDETQNDLRKLARSILEVRATPARIREVEATEDGIDRDLWAELAAADLLGVALPEEVGGSGHSVLEACVVLEEIGRHVAPVPLFSTIGLAALPIAVLGRPEQRKRLLAPVVDGSSLLTAALQEPARHDPFDLATTATKDGTGWRLEGRKVAVPHGPLADRILVSARTGDGAAGLFVIDPSAPGVHVERTRSTHREVQANIELDGALVDADDVLGGTDDLESLEVAHRHAVACLCATASGVLQSAVRLTADYISQREQFGRPIATFQGATLRAADAYIDAEAVSVTAWSAIWKLANGREDADEALGIAKFWVADGGQRVVHACQHLHGGMGVDTDYPIHRYFLWAKELEIALGAATPQLVRLGAGMAG